MMLSNSETSNGRIPHDEGRAQLDLELEAIGESLITIPVELGLPESTEMEKLRLDFAKEKDSEGGKMAELASEYMRLCQEAVDNSEDKQIDLVFSLNILMVLFYLPRETEVVLVSFKQACDDVREFPEGPYTARIEEILNKLIPT